MIRTVQGTLYGISERETLRYLGYANAHDDGAIRPLIKECENELLPLLAPAACYDIFPVAMQGETLDLGFVTVNSRSLARHLSGCSRTVVFAATVGVGVDRLIAKYSRLSPSKSALFQALGAAATEDWCDMLCARFTKELGAKKSRFSCGYGDAPLSLQRDIFRALAVTKQIGITLSDHCFMTPTKSVTAFVGIPGENTL